MYSKTVLTFIAFLLVSVTFAQVSVTVKAKGMDRSSAKQNAMRDAVEEAVGTYINSKSQVENFLLVKDAVVTNTEGYIKSSSILDEGEGSDGLYFVELHAEVSTQPVEKGIESLQMMIGGLKFMVAYDCRISDAEQLANYEFAQSRINEQLSKNKYEYISKNRFDESCIKTKAFTEKLKDESVLLYRKKMGYFADAEFIIFIKNIEIETQERNMGGVSLSSCKTTVFCEAYDNSTDEGLGEMIFDAVASNPKKEVAVQNAISKAVETGMPDFIKLFNRYMNSWVNNGAPYQLRFYEVPTYGEMLQLKKALTDDADFGSEITIKRDAVNPNLFKLYCSFKKTQSEMLDRVYEKLYEVDKLAEKSFDAKTIYGRQLFFAPVDYTISD